MSVPAAQEYIVELGPDGWGLRATKRNPATRLSEGDRRNGDYRQGSDNSYIGRFPHDGLAFVEDEPMAPEGEVNDMIDMGSAGGRRKRGKGDGKGKAKGGKGGFAERNGKRKAMQSKIP